MEHRPFRRQGLSVTVRCKFDLLRELGSDCHLTGDGGDTLLGAHLAYLADLAQVRRIRLLCRHAVGWARLHRTSVWPLVIDACRHGNRSPRMRRSEVLPDHYLGLRANIAELRELADGRLVECGLVDPDQLRRQLDHVEAGLPITFSDFEPVLAAEVWLRAIEVSQPAARWQPTVRQGE